MKREALLAVVIQSAALLTGCGDLGMCGNEVRSTTASPTGKLRAVVFTRDCGATTGFSTQVSILNSGDALPDEPGNVLIADGTISLVVTWQSDSQVLVSGDLTTRLSKQETEIQRVRIQYGR